MKRRELLFSILLAPLMRGRKKLALTDDGRGLIEVMVDTADGDAIISSGCITNIDEMRKLYELPRLFGEDRDE